jgi:hypothetical protein
VEKKGPWLLGLKGLHWCGDTTKSKPVLFMSAESQKKFVAFCNGWYEIIRKMLSEDKFALNHPKLF